jgi:succinate--hydroxymethylglutarate CoA-transferase
MEMVFDHPQTHARDMIAEVPLDAAKSGKIKLIGL